MKRDILCISSIDWDFIWQGHQEIMSTLAADGHRVLFVENTGVRAPRVRDLPRLRQRLRNWWRGTEGFREERPNLFVYSPLVLPLPYSRLARWVNRFLLMRALRRWMRATGFSRPIVVDVPADAAGAAISIARLDPQLTIYYCIDDLASSSPGGATHRRRARSDCSGEADLVFVTSEKLRQRAAQFSERRAPVSVRRQLRARSSACASAPTPPPADIAALQRPDRRLRRRPASVGRSGADRGSRARACRT